MCVNDVSDDVKVLPTYSHYVLCEYENDFSATRKLFQICSAVFHVFVEASREIEDSVLLQ